MPSKECLKQNEKLISRLQPTRPKTIAVLESSSSCGSKKDKDFSEVGQAHLKKWLIYNIPNRDRVNRDSLPTSRKLRRRVFTGWIQIMRLLGPESVGRTVDLSLIRGGAPAAFKVVIGERPVSFLSAIGAVRAFMVAIAIFSVDPAISWAQSSARKLVAKTR